MIVLQTGSNAVTVGGRQLDQFDGNMMTIGEVLVQWIGGNIHATFESTGIAVFWNVKNGVQVSVQDRLRSSLCGMCGFYNGRSNDDLRLSGTTTATSNIETFALSWLCGSGNTAEHSDGQMVHVMCSGMPHSILVTLQLTRSPTLPIVNMTSVIAP